MATTTVRIGEYVAGIGAVGVALFVLGIGIVHVAAGVVQAPLAVLAGCSLLAAGVLAPARARRAATARTGRAIGAWAPLALAAAGIVLFGLFFGVSAL